MRTLLTIFLIQLIASSTDLLSQETYTFTGWNDSVVMKAHTGINSDFLNEDEQKVILLINLARADGPLFAATFLNQYLILKEKKSNKYVKSLIRDLQKVKNLPMLKPEKDLYDVARDHATRAGVKGFQGHKGFNGRYESLLETYIEVGENIYYGKYTPEEIVIQLLIDQGIEDLGHRLNILHPKFNSIGVSIKPHKTDQYNCVMSFGHLPRSYRDYIQ